MADRFSPESNAALDRAQAALAEALDGVTFAPSDTALLVLSVLAGLGWKPESPGSGTDD